MFPQVSSSTVKSDSTSSGSSDSSEQSSDSDDEQSASSSSSGASQRGKKKSKPRRKKDGKDGEIFSSTVKGPEKNKTGKGTKLLREKATKKKDSALERSVVVGKKGAWTFATPKQIRHPGNKFILKLINKKWTDGSKPEPFTLSDKVGERAVDWNTYARGFKRHIEMKGDASQWQKANYLAAFTGPEIKRIVETKKWLPDKPKEGRLYYDKLLKKLTKYFKQFTDSESAHECLTTATQRPDETITKFWDRLEKLAIMCEIDSRGQLVRNVLMNGLKDKELREFASLSRLSVKRILEVGVNREVKREVTADLRSAKTEIVPEVLAIDRTRPGGKRLPQHYTGTGERNQHRQKPYDSYSRGYSSGGGGRYGSGSGANSSGGGGRYGSGSGANSRGTFGGAGSGDRYSSFNRCKNCDRRHQPNDYCTAKEKDCHGCGVRGHLQHCCPKQGKSEPEVSKGDNKPMK